MMKTDKHLESLAPGPTLSRGLWRMECELRIINDFLVPRVRVMRDEELRQLLLELSKGRKIKFITGGTYGQEESGNGNE
jgi:hypothetical protein